jgi:acetyltransferase-like isoleucine patch superfamily enzyme
MSFLDPLTQLFRRLRFKLRGIKIGKAATIGSSVSVRRRRGQIAIGDDCTIENGVILDAYDGSIEIGRWIFIGPYTVIYGHGGVTIGEGTLVAMHCQILSSNHTVKGLDVPIRSQPDVLLPTHIGRDVWLGAGVIVLGGVTIGDGCVVGAGSVVTKNLPAGSIAYGVPAIVKSRRDAPPPTRTNN